jgi:endonuclease YncB( thermonuclease family)
MSLSDCTYKNTEKFNFKDKVYQAKCVKVYDGDTITVVFKVFGAFHKFSIRMDGYDSPEMRSKNTDPQKKELEKSWACKSRDFLSDIILDKVITLKCKDYDKYGRIMAVVELEGKNINDLMISNGYTRVYDGGHKCEWDFSPFDSMMNNNESTELKDEDQKKIH